MKQQHNESRQLQNLNQRLNRMYKYWIDEKNLNTKLPLSEVLQRCKKSFNEIIASAKYLSWEEKRFFQVRATKAYNLSDKFIVGYFLKEKTKERNKL